MNKILSLAAQRVFVQKLNTERTCDVPKGMNDEEDSWDFEGIVTAEEVAITGIRGKLGEVQRVCKEGGEAVPTTIIDVINLAREGIKA